MPFRQGRIFLAVFFLILIFGVPFHQAGLEIYRGGWPGFLELFYQIPTQANLRAFEKKVEEASWFAGTLRPKMQTLMFHLFRSLGDKALLGRNHWLFYKPDIEYLIEPPPVADRNVVAGNDPVAAIISFQTQLQARGIQLLVLPVPGKASVYPEMLTTLSKPDNPRAVVSNTLHVINQLRSAGVEVVDLFHFFHHARAVNGSLEGSGAYYLSQDTHWAGNAVQMTARYVARRLLDLGWVKPGSTEYGLRTLCVRRRSDIIRMVKVANIETYFPGDSVEVNQVSKGAGGELYKDDPESSVLVLGDSFLRIYQTDEPRAGGFIAHLARELKQPLTSIVNDGGASTLVRQELSRRPDLLSRKSVVIWEFVERDIRFGTEGWKYVVLPSDAVSLSQQKKG